MTMNFELKMTQTTRMIMTQELRQSIALLQLSTYELLDCIQEELAENPLLEIAEEKDDKELEPADLQEQGEAGEEKPDPLQELLDYFEDDDYTATDFSVDPGYERNTNFLENCITRDGEKNLTDYLSFQLKTSAAGERRQLIGEYLIGNLDANGYLQGNPEEHARHLGILPEELLAALALIQTFDPPGVGACSLEECLLIQLRQFTPNPNVEKIVTGHLPDLAAGKYRLVAEKVGISLEELREALALIRRLNPKPGACFGDGTEVSYITPDIFVEKIDGQYIITSGDRIPSLVINNFYRSMLRQSGDEQVRSFVKKNLEGALWFIKSIEHRRKVIYQVASEIVRVQEPFLEKGMQHLKPLTLKMVASAIDVHESTVSRATTNKYMQTPRGLYPLKFFFPGRVGGETGTPHASASIKQALRQLIEAENPTDPLSDQQLARRLHKNRGVKISRRTVAKYREELQIPASFKRRCL